MVGSGVPPFVIDDFSCYEVILRMISKLFIILLV